MLAQARRALDVRRAGRARPPEDVRRLPRRRPHEERARASTSAMSERPDAMAAAAPAPARARGRRRAPISTRCSRGSTPARPTRRCSPPSRRRRRSRRRARAGGDRRHGTGPRGGVGRRCAPPARHGRPRPPARSTTTLFVGVGKSEVNLHASHWLDRVHDRDGRWPSCARRSPRLGLARRPGVQRVRGPPVGGAARRCGCWSPGDGRSAAGADRRAARVLRPPSRAVGLRLLHCNNAIVLLPITTAT